MPASPAAADKPSRTNRRVLGRLLGFGLLFALAILNWQVPVLRFAWRPLDHLFFLGVLAVPVVLFLYAVRLRGRIVQIVTAILLSPLILLALLLALGTLFLLRDTLVSGTDPSFEPIRTVAVPGSRLQVYRTNGGATTAYGAVVRQERTLVPGLSIVRDVYRAYPAEDAAVEYKGNRTVIFDRNPQSRQVLRPFVWF